MKEDRAKGIVYLVGGGPGDPALLTLRAAELLRSAEVVAYDALISDGVLAMVGPDAELLAVGHRGKGSSRAAYRIHPEVVARARAGQSVVRLKCGDPFVFGRGGEEAEELLEAGIEFEVVPGISAALGAAAYAGIPLTHRQVASDVTLVTGHDLLSGAESASAWSQLARGSGTLVMFMASKKLRENLDRLVEHGRSSTAPAAYIASATTARQNSIVGTISDLEEKTREINRDDPALVIVGEVVKLRERLAWLERKPLFGRSVLVARARPGASEIAVALRALGAEVIEAPQVDIAPLPSYAALDAALACVGTFDALVFGCAPGVESTLRRLGELEHDVRALAELPLVAVGKQAAERLRASGLLPKLVVAGACRDAVGAHSELLRDGRLLLITSEDGRPSLVSEVTALGASVETAPAYRTRRKYPRVRPDAGDCLGRFDLIVVPSSSAAQAIFGSEFGASLTQVPVVALGPSAEAAARRHGATRVAKSDADSIAAAIAKAVELLARSSESAPSATAFPSEIRP